MGKKNIYTVKDYRTGEVIARGTAYELEACGIVPKGYHASEWAKHENNRMKGRMYSISVEKWSAEEEKKRTPKGRPMKVYSCYDAAGSLIGKGTARELCEMGVFGNDSAAYYTYTQQGGRCIKRGIAKMTCSKELRQYSLNNAKSKKPPKPKGCTADKKPKRPTLRRIKDPMPLDYDVHDLMIYNAIAKKAGRKELTYGYWAAAGKPTRP